MRHFVQMLLVILGLLVLETRPGVAAESIALTPHVLVKPHTGDSTR